MRALFGGSLLLGDAKKEEIDLRSLRCSPSEKYEARKH
jgi:hypothetical protein